MYFLAGLNIHEHLGTSYSQWPTVTFNTVCWNIKSSILTLQVNQGGRSFSSHANDYLLIPVNYFQGSTQTTNSKNYYSADCSGGTVENKCAILKVSTTTTGLHEWMVHCTRLHPSALFIMQQK